MELKKYKLGEILDVTRGASLSGKFYAAEGEYVRLTCGNFDYQNNCFKENKAKDNLYYIGDFKPDFLMKEGDIITPLTEQAIGLLGSTAIIPESGKYIQSQDVAKIVCKEHLLDKDFAFYLISSNLVKQQLSAAAQQTKIRHTSPDKIKDCIVWIPELEEQKRIGKLLRTIDLKIELNRQLNHNLEQQAQALFKAWFVDFEPFRDGEFVNSVLGSTPKELPITYIENIPHNIESGKRPKGGATLIGVPSIGAENIKGLGYYDYSKTKYIPEEYAQTIKKGKINGYELLIYKDGGKPGYFIPNFTIFGEGFPFNEMYINEHVFLLDLMDCGYNVFAYFYMQTPYIMNQLNSIGGKAAIPGINTKDVECLPIYSNESPYVKKFGEIVLPFIKTILSNSLENAKQAKVRDTLLPKLMSGELKINEIETEK